MSARNSFLAVTAGCQTNADCSDLVREGVFGECSPGGPFSVCLLTKK
jgi:hypothetical protein